MPDVMIPTVHRNGTSPERLRDDALAAAQALNIALDKLSEMGPNARDYYPQGPDAAARAARAHGDRIESLRAIRDEIMAIHDGIDEQIADRDAQRRSAGCGTDN